MAVNVYPVEKPVIREPEDFGKLFMPVEAPLNDVELKVLKVAEKRGPGQPDEFEELLIRAAMVAELGHAVLLASVFPKYVRAVWCWAIGNLTERADAQKVR